MCTKFVECTLGVKYREVHEDGTVTGGPFRYLPVAFSRFGSGTSRALTLVFAVALFLFGAVGGNMFQANQTFAQAREVTGGDDGYLGSSGSALIFGLVLAFLVGAVIIGGITSIARVTSRLVPAMGLLYVGTCLLVIAGNLVNVPAAIGEIISGRLRPGRRRRWRDRRPHHRVPARGVLQRGRRRVGADRPFRGQDQAPGERRIRGPARALHRHRRHLHPDRARRS